MCIGQDVHGNIKLSLKATLRGPGGSEANDVAEGSATSAKEKDNIWAPVWNASSTEEQQNSSSELAVDKDEVAEAKPSTSQIPVILIRSAEECDEEEKSTRLNRNRSSKDPPRDNGTQLDRKSKSPPKSKSRQSQNVIDSSSHSGPLPYTNAKKPKLSMQKESKSDTQRPEGDKKEANDKASVTEKDLKLGTKVTAKVHQIRAHGLVLDLGGGLRGMYRFEVGIIFFVSQGTVYSDKYVFPCFLPLSALTSFSRDFLLERPKCIRILQLISIFSHLSYVLMIHLCTLSICFSMD